MNNDQIKKFPLHPSTENPNPDYKPPLGNKEIDFKELVFANAFFQDLVLQGIEKPQNFEELKLKEQYLTLFCFAVGRDLLMELIRKAGLKKEYEEWKELENGIR